VITQYRKILLSRNRSDLLFEINDLPSDGADAGGKFRSQRDNFR